MLNFNTTVCVGSSFLPKTITSSLSYFNTTVCVGSRNPPRTHQKYLLNFNTTVCVGSSFNRLFDPKSCYCISIQLFVSVRARV